VSEARGEPHPHLSSFGANSGCAVKPSLAAPRD
jgi:hypothetical protein